MLPYGPLPADTIHVCVDRQRVFAEQTPWHTSWIPRVLPVVLRIVQAHAERTVFTRFVPVRRTEDANGAWRRYYERWAELTLERADPALYDLVLELQPFSPLGSLRASPPIHRGVGGLRTGHCGARTDSTRDHRYRDGCVRAGRHPEHRGSRFPRRRADRRDLQLIRQYA